LTADGLGRSDWEPVDGGHGMPGGTEHLKFLLHMEGADNSTTIPDEIGAVWTAHGAACLKTAISKFGGSSVIFNTNDYISATVAAPGTADFQLEAWLYPTAFWGSGDNWYAIGGNMRTWNDNAGVEIGLDANGSIIVYNGFNGGYLPGLRTARMMTLNAWNHIALVKISGVYYVYVNGFRDSNTFVNANNISSTSWEWGHGIYQVSDTYFRGYIDEAAYYDYAKWTGWYYDPPTMPYSLTDEVVRGTTIRFRGGDAVNLPTLFTREPFIEEDTGTLHIGPFSYGAGGGGDVVGPAGATDGHVALFDGATGKIIKDGGAPAGGGDVYGDPAGVSGNVPVFDGDGYHLIDSGTTPGGGSTDVVKVTAGVGDIVIPGLAASADIAGAGGAGTSEEYDTSTTGLTWNSAPDVCDSNTTIKSHLYIKTINSSEYLGWKAWSPAGAFDARAKLHLAHITTDTYMDIALMVMNSDNSLRADAYFIRRGSTGVFSIGAATYNGSYSGQGSEEPVGTNFVYARLIRDGSNNFTFLWSSDGILWTQIATVNFTLTVARIGYRISDGAVIGAVDWLRTDV
jgi:hypothetical protein